MRRAGGNNKAHHQKRSRQDAGGVQGKAGRCYGGHKGRRCQPRRRIHRGHVAAELVRHLRSATMTPDSHSAPTPTQPGRSKTRPHKPWAVSWRRSCEQKEGKNTGEEAKPPLRYSLGLSGHFRVWVTVWVRRLTHILTHTIFSVFATKKHRKPKFSMLFGAAGQIRTADLVITNDALYRLSYSSKSLSQERSVIIAQSRDLSSGVFIFYICIF